MRQRGYRVLATAFLLLCFGFAARAHQVDPAHLQDVVYGHKQGVALTMDVFKPQKPDGIAVLFMVSGGWVSSYEAINPGLAKIFTDRGQTVFEVVHGSQPKFTIPEIVQDVQRAVRFIRTHAAEYGVNPNRLGVIGASSGGHLSLMIGALGADGSPTAKDPVDRASSAVQAVACFFPPTDFLNYGKEGVNALKVDMLKPFWPAFGITDATPPEERERVARLDSPIYAVTAKMPPTLIIHGDADTLVPLQQSQLFMAKLEQLKVPHQLDVRPGKGHGWPDLGKDVPLLADWFDRYLQPVSVEGTR
jgi:acetyl esterase/lipase